MNNFKVDFDEIPWTSPRPGARFKVYKEGTYQLRLVEFSDGFSENEWCAKGHRGYIIEGELEMTFSDKKVIYKAGDAIVIPEGEAYKHKGKILSKKVRFFVMEEI